MDAAGCAVGPPPDRGRRDLISVRDLSREDAIDVFERASAFEGGPGPRASRPKVLAQMFDQRSTRTRLGFEAAAIRLGHQAMDAFDQDRGRIGQADGESLADHVRTISCYADAIVVRSRSEEMPSLVAAHADVPVVNAGNGGAEHPTQALVDLYAIRRLRGDPELLRIGLSCDTRARFAVSFARLLAAFPPRELRLCVDPRIGVGPAMADAADVLRAAGTEVSLVDDIAAVLDCDVVSVQMQDQSRFANAGIGSDALGSWSEAEGFRLTAGKLVDSGSDALILNPMPRFSEICTSVDALPNAGYFRQVALSLYVRMAVLDRIFAGIPWTGRS